MDKQRFLIMMRSSPYGSHQARAAIDVALRAAAFDQAGSVVLIDDGVLQLVPAQDSKAAGLKSIPDMLSAMTLYEVEDLFAHTPSIEQHLQADNALPDDVKVIDDVSLKTLVAAADQVMVF